MTLHGGVRGVKESIAVFVILPPAAALNSALNEWSFNHLRVSSSSTSSSTASYSPSSLSSTSAAELGGNPGKGSRGAAHRPTDAPPRRATNMLTRVKSAVAGFMGGIMAGGSSGGGGNTGSEMPLKFPYMRPQFLGLSADEIECSADHIARPILILKETRRLPWATGYAE